MTTWNSGNPPRPGVYERRLADHSRSYFARWDGKAWYIVAPTPALAAIQTRLSLFNSPPFQWREVDETTTPTP